MTDRWTDPEQNRPETKIDEMVLRVFENKPLARLEYHLWHSEYLKGQIDEFSQKVQEFLGIKPPYQERIEKLDFERRYCSSEFYPKYQLILMSQDYRTWIWFEHWTESTTLSLGKRTKYENRNEEDEDRKKAVEELFKEALTLLRSIVSTDEIFHLTGETVAKHRD